MKIFMIRIIVIIILCILIAIKMKDFINYTVSVVKEKRKKYYVGKELIELNQKHNSVFFYYKLIPADYDVIIDKVKKKKICVTKKEINSIYKELIKNYE